LDRKARRDRLGPAPPALIAQDTDKHQYGGISTLAVEQSVTGQLFISGSGCGVMYSY
jgi:hypothetical protein